MYMQGNSVSLKLCNLQLCKLWHVCIFILELKCYSIYKKVLHYFHLFPRPKDCHSSWANEPFRINENKALKTNVTIGCRC